MNIQRVEIRKVVLPLKAPFRTAFGELRDRAIIFIRLFDKSGIVGLGEAANMDLPLYEPDFNAATIALLNEIVSSQILNKGIDTIDELEKCYENLRGNNIAKVAIESAYWHIESQKRGKPLNMLWGGRKKKIPVAISIGLGSDLKESVDKVKMYVEESNPRRVKLKIKPGIDVMFIQKVRDMFPWLRIQIDANAGYTLKDIDMFKALDGLDLIMIEQPLQYNDIVDHALLQKKIKTPICLDESICNYHMAEQAIKIGACKIMNIKPQRVGGYWQAKKISQLCAKNLIPVWCGGMIESGWGQLFNCAIATLPNYKLDNDICLTKWYLADDIICDEINEKDGMIDISSTYSLFKIDKRKFDKYTASIEIIK